MQKMSPYLAEFLGTLFFLFVIIFTGQALPIGLALIIVILILGKFSNGGHFNPAVTIMMVFAKKLKAGEALPYIIAQVLGGLTALFIYNRTK